MEKERWHRLQWVEAWEVQPWEVQMWDVQMWDVCPGINVRSAGFLPSAPAHRGSVLAYPHPGSVCTQAGLLRGSWAPWACSCTSCSLPQRFFSHRRAVLEAEGCVSSPYGPRVPDVSSFPAWNGCLPSPHCSTSRDFICDTNHRNCWVLSSGQTANPRQARRCGGPPPPFRHRCWPCVLATAGNDQVGHEVGIIVTAICQFAIRDSMDLIFAKKDLLF